MKLGKYKYLIFSDFNMNLIKVFKIIQSRWKLDMQLPKDVVPLFHCQIDSEPFRRIF